MIHYHGGPIGKGQAHEFFRGRHALVSLQDKRDLAVIAEVSPSFIFDNGSFSVWKSGKKMDVEKYYMWVEDWQRHPGFDWALIPDVINGNEKENDKLIDDWPFKRHLGVPVWHLNESVGRLKHLAFDWPSVALGSTEGMEPGSEKFWSRMAIILDAVCDERGRPGCKLHGLRMLDPDIFRFVPLASADSANAVLTSFQRSSGFGYYAPTRESQKANIIADRIEAHNSAPIWNPSQSITVQQELSLCGH